LEIVALAGTVHSEDVEMVTLRLVGQKQFKILLRAVYATDYVK
jgi:hypothetical protein